MEIINIVGDDYEKFTKYHPNTVTASKFIELSHVYKEVSDLKIEIGQGIAFSQYDIIIKDFSNIISEDSKNNNFENMSALTHKSIHENVLLSNMKKVRDERYVYNLRSFAQSDRLSDHVTGIHVGGMLIIEAARQAGTASIEHEYLSEDSNSSLVLSTLDSEFFSYAFPLQMQIDVKMSSKQSENRSPQITLKINICQNYSKIATITIVALIMPKKVISKIESNLAKKLSPKVVLSQETSDLVEDALG